MLGKIIYTLKKYGVKAVLLFVNMNARAVSSIQAVMVGITGAIVSLIVGLSVIGQLQTTTGGMNLPSNATSIINSFLNNFWSASNLLTIIPIVVIAGVILAYIRLR